MLRAQALHALDRLLHVEIRVGEQIGLGNHHGVGSLKDDRVLDEFVMPLGHAQDDHAEVFPQIETSGADQVAHVFDHQCVDLGQIEVLGSRGDHHGVKVACPVRVNLHYGHTQGVDPLGVDRPGNIPLDNRRSEAALEVVEQCLQ